MAGRDALNLRVDSDLRPALEQAARDGNQTVSALVRDLLRDYLRERGYLKSEPAESA